MPRSREHFDWKDVVSQKKMYSWFRIISLIVIEILWEFQFFFNSGIFLDLKWLKVDDVITRTHTSHAEDLGSNHINCKLFIIMTKSIVDKICILTAWIVQLYKHSRNYCTLYQCHLLLNKISCNKIKIVILLIVRVFFYKNLVFFTEALI